MEEHPNKNTPEAIALHNKRQQSGETSSTQEDRLTDEIHLNKYFTAEQKILTEVEKKKRQRTEEEMKKLEAFATTDTLTGLLNRRGWDNEIDKLIAEYNRHPEDHAQKYALLALDIDFFKKINDTYGHDGGDIVLEETAHILKTLFRETDIIARFGGEEFFVLIKDTNVEQVILRLAEGRIDNTPGVSFKIQIKGVSVPVNFSGGIVSLIPKNKEIVEEIRNTADQLLYKAKELGRNRIITQ